MPYIDVFRTMFPEGAGYEHDKIDRRTELSEAQQPAEPRNADSHLAFMAGALRTCVCLPEPAGRAGVVHRSRRRPRRHASQAPDERARLLGRGDRRAGACRRAGLGPQRRLGQPEGSPARRLRAVRRSSSRSTASRRGASGCRWRPGERHAGLTVNEYETLLMRHDLSEVLRDPLRFMAEKAGHMLGNPRAIPAKTLDYAKYDLVRVFNRLVDALGLRESLVESVLVARDRDAGVALPADEALGQPARVRPPRRPRRRSSKAPTRARSSCSGTAATARRACSTSR